MCVQSVVADGDDLWVFDPGAPAQGLLVPGAPKLVRIDLDTSEVERVIRFNQREAPQGSYLNDIRFSPDGRHAYITDSGVSGAIVVLDLRTGTARRTLDGHPSTQVDRTVNVMADGRTLRRPDGRGVEHSADGIALSNDGGTLHWQAVKGKRVYRISTRALESTRLSTRQVGRRVRPVGGNGPADGLLIDRRDDLLVTSVEDRAVKLRAGDEDGLETGNELAPLVQDERLRWPDTLAEAPAGDVYVTFPDPGLCLLRLESGPVLPTGLYRIER